MEPIEPSGSGQLPDQPAVTPAQTSAEQPSSVIPESPSVLGPSDDRLLSDVPVDSLADEQVIPAAVNSMQIVRRDSFRHLKHNLEIIGLGVTILLIAFGLFAFVYGRIGNNVSKAPQTQVVQLTEDQVTSVDTAGRLVSINGNIAVKEGLSVTGSTELSSLRILQSAQVGGEVVATLFRGSGAELTNLNASNILLGTLSNERLPGNGQITLQLGSGLVGGGTIGLGGSIQIGLANTGTSNISTDALLQGGNTFGEDILLGTTDNTGLQFQTNATVVAELTSSGAARFRNRTNSTQAFQIQTATGSTFLVADSTNERIGIGTSAPNAQLHVVGESRLEGSLRVGNILPQNAGTTIGGFIELTHMGGATTTSVYNDMQKFVAVDQSGAMHYVFTDYDANELYLNSCLDTQCSSMTRSLIVSDPNSIDSATIRIGPDGLPRIIYITYPTNNELHFIQCLNLTCSSKTDTVVDSKQYGFYDVSFDLDGQGFAHILYNDYFNDQLLYARCSTMSCSSFTISVINSLSSNVVVIDIGSDDLPRIFYQQSTNEYVFARCTSIDCATYVSQTIINTSDYLYYAHMGLSPNNIPTFTYPYVIGTDKLLRLITCTDANCTTRLNQNFTITNSSSTPYDLVQSSVTIGTDGLPAIAYATGDLTYETGYIKCLDTQCTTYNMINFDDPGAGYGISMDLTQNNLPRIVYLNSAEQDFLVKIFNTATGLDQTTPGTDIGLSDQSFGAAYLQGLTLKSSDVGSLASLFSYAASTDYMQFAFKDETIGYLSGNTSGIQVENNLGQKLLSTNNSSNAVVVGGGINSAAALNVINLQDKSVFAVDTLDDSVLVNKDNSTYFTQSLAIIRDQIIYANNTNTAILEDINGDGLDDYIDYYVFTNSVRVFFATSPGMYDTVNMVQFPVPSQIYHFIAKDINNDNRVDLLYTYMSGATFTADVVLNAGSNTFSPVTSYAFGGFGYGATAEDINSDGYKDLVMVYNTTLYYRLNNGNGTFGVLSTATVPGPIALTDGEVADLDGDGDIDIIRPSLVSSNGVSVYINNGSFVFASPVAYPTKGYVRHAKPIDLNNDGLLDIVADVNDSQIVTFINQGGGIFSSAYEDPNARAYFISGYKIDDNKIGYFNNDRFVDFLFGTTVLLNDGKGRFTKAVDVRPNNNQNIHYMVLPYDNNNDGLTDIMVSGPGVRQTYLNNFKSLVSNPSLEVNAKSGAIAQIIKVDGSSLADAFQIRTSNDDLLTAFDNNGSLILGGVLNTIDYTKTSYVNTSWTARSIYSEDINNDGSVDLVYFFNTSAYVRLNNGNGTFGSEVSYSLPGGVSYLTLEDVDADGIKDLVGTDVFSPPAIELVVRKGLANGTFNTAQTYSATRPGIMTSPGSGPIVIADFNGDNVIDIGYRLFTIIGSAYSYYLEYWPGNGSGSFNPLVRTETPSTILAFRASFEDVNSDGYIDIIYSHEGSENLDIQINDGAGNFSSTGVVQLSGGKIAASILKDVNQDGVLDLFIIHRDGGARTEFSYYAGVGDGTFVNTNNSMKVIPNDYVLNFNGYGTESINELTDINYDGYLDYIDVLEGRILYGLSDFTFSDFIYYKQVRDGIASFSFGDYNNDGNMDFAEISSTNLDIYTYTVKRQPKGSISTTGEFLQRSQVDSTSAFSLQNSLGVDIFKVDTVNSSVRVVATKSTTSLFRVDNQSGSNLFNIDTQNSSVTVRSPSNNTAAFQVQNAANTPVLSVDTQNIRVQIASAGDLRFLGSGNTRNAITKDFTCTATEAVNDVVIVTAAGTVGRTTTAASNRVAGVVVAKPTTTSCTVAFAGVVQVWFSGNANPTTIGDPVETSATAGAARATTTPVVGGMLGKSLSNKDGSNLVWILLGE